MRTIVALMLFAAACARAATTFTEFYCNSTGTNVNAGSTTNETPTLSATSGNWTNATQTFLFPGATDLSGITNGMWASVYPDGATVAVYIGRISAVNDAADFVTVSNFTATGIAPSDGTGTRSIRIGGAWYGPWKAGAADVPFPFGFVNNLLTNTSLSSARVNFKNDRLYAITNLNITSNGPVRYEGHTLTPGDNGMPVFSGASAGAAFNVLSVTASVNIDVANMYFLSNGSSGNADLINVLSSSQRFKLERCAIVSSRRRAILFAEEGMIIECHVATNNLGATTGNLGGIEFGASAGGSVAARCVSVFNRGSCSGFYSTAAGGSFVSCISAHNFNGFAVNSSAPFTIFNCDAYGNSTNGLDAFTTPAVHIESCNFLMSTNGYGLTISATNNAKSAYVANCGFGSGSMANGLGDINRANMNGVSEFGTVTYASGAVPWMDPDAGDFRINLAAARNSGKGDFLQPSSSYTGTVGFPDIGAAQATNDAAGVSTVISVPIVRR